MSDAIIKALSFIIFIVIGFFIKKKFQSKDEVNGIKKIVLLLALPATIFIALLKIKISSSFILLPLFALAFNVFLYIITPGLLSVLNLTDKSIINTTKLLLPSLAPGLSCMPFILEFLGESYLAKAAMADLGNKFFVLFILYLLAINWYYKNQTTKQEPVLVKLKALSKVMCLEPVNLFIAMALILVLSGITMSNLPLFIQDTLERLSSLMTPLVLLFIGLAVSLKKKQFSQIFSLLMLKHGMTLFVIGLIVAIGNIPVKNDILLMLSFGLSACSFWPFAHISSISAKETSIDATNKTFNIDFALSILALSLPFSVMFILAILIAGETFTDASNIFVLSISTMCIGIAKPFYKWSKNGALIKKRYRKVE